MTNSPIFTGAATALVTPLNEQGIDYASLDRLIDWQIDQGINALVIAGTTGEGSTLTDEEHRALLKHSAERVAGRVPVIAGTGSNDTDYAVDLTAFACEAGCDAMLVVTPYYNKATQKGLVKMYNIIADASTKPLIVYNVPSRTGVNIEPATYAELAQNPNIKGIKEANSNISKIVEISLKSLSPLGCRTSGPCSVVWLYPSTAFVVMTLSIGILRTPVHLCDDNRSKVYYRH